MDGPEDARVPVDRPHVGVVGEEGAEGGPEDGRGHAHQHRGEEDVAGVEEEEVRDVEGVGERGEEEGGARAEPLHQGRRGEAGQREAQVHHHVAATHRAHIRTLLFPYHASLTSGTVPRIIHGLFLKLWNCRSKAEK